MNTNCNKWNGIGNDGNSNKTYELNNGQGKVKEYKNIKLRFVGEYLNGQMKGKGKKYDNNGKLRFEGDYLCN